MFLSNLIVPFRKFLLVIAVLLFVNYSAEGQETNAKSSNEITLNDIYNEVWLPFMQSYRNLDLEQFKALQTSDLTKVSISRNTIQSTSEYFAEIDAFFNQFKLMNRQMDIRFSILSSAFGTDKVYQTGYYAIGARTAASEQFQTMGFGYFTVVLDKTPEGWKISLDADKQTRIDEEEFRKSGTVYELKE